MHICKNLKLIKKKSHRFKISIEKKISMTLFMFKLYSVSWAILSPAVGYQIERQRPLKPSSIQTPRNLWSTKYVKHADSTNYYIKERAVRIKGYSVETKIFS
jgi:hypothetical protein